MELTSKQRAQLRGMANELQPIVHIERSGKEWEVGLNNGMELTFDSHLRLVDVDD